MVLLNAVGDIHLIRESGVCKQPFMPHCEGTQWVWQVASVSAQQSLTWAEGVGGVKVDGKFVRHLRKWRLKTTVQFQHCPFLPQLSFPPSCRSPLSLSFVLFISSLPWQHRWVDSCIILWIRMYNAYSFITVCLYVCASGGGGGGVG